ncbi:MAG: hypothetical protein LBC84_01225 [Prevotellaceae bacterium]|jgi:ferredoxin|nr:hypothetical protein [Prevotellaceae bacterium]
MKKTIIFFTFLSIFAGIALYANQKHQNYLLRYLRATIDYDTCVQCQTCVAEVNTEWPNLMQSGDHLIGNYPIFLPGGLHLAIWFHTCYAFEMDFGTSDYNAFRKALCRGRDACPTQSFELVDLLPIPD